MRAARRMHSTGTLCGCCFFCLFPTPRSVTMTRVRVCQFICFFYYCHRALGSRSWKFNHRPRARIRRNVLPGQVRVKRCFRVTRPDALTSRTMENEFVSRFAYGNFALTAASQCEMKKCK